MRLVGKTYDPESDMTLIFDTETLIMINKHLLPKGNVLESIRKLDEERNYHTIQSWLSTGLDLE